MTSFSKVVSIQPERLVAPLSLPLQLKVAMVLSSHQSLFETYGQRQSLCFIGKLLVTLM